MLSERHRKRVEQATVKLVRKGAQGVLMNGGFIITAAHCIEWSCDGYMALGNDHIEEIKSHTGTFFAECYFVDPVSDIAVLGALSNEGYDSTAYTQLRKNTAPVPIHASAWPLSSALPPFPSPDSLRERELKAYIYTHEHIWIEGVASMVRAGVPTLWFDGSGVPIKGGTSGGPIVSEQGKLLGVVSSAIENVRTNEQDPSHHPIVNNALPVWLLRTIKRGYIV